MKRYYSCLKAAAIIPFTLLLHIYLLVGEKRDILVSAELWEMLFGSRDQYFVISLSSAAFIFIFMVLFGNQIYRYFCTGSVYVFTRIGSRSHWYGRQLLSLLGLSAFYALLLTLSNLLVCIVNCSTGLDPATGPVFLGMAVYSCLLVFMAALIVNLLSLLIGNLPAFVSTVLLICALMSIPLNNAGGSFVHMLNPFYLKLGGPEALLQKGIVTLIECLLIGLAGGVLVNKIDIFYAGDE